jgi:hypothetical protein
MFCRCDLCRHVVQVIRRIIEFGFSSMKKARVRLVHQVSPPVFARMSAVAELIIQGHEREADQVHSGGEVPQDNFRSVEPGDPAKPEHSADDAEGEKGVKSKEEKGFVEDSAQLRDRTVLEAGNFMHKVKEGPAHVHHKVGSRPDKDDPAGECQGGVPFHTETECHDPKEELEDAERDTNGETEEDRAAEEPLDRIGLPLAGPLFGSAGSSVHSGIAVLDFGRADINRYPLLPGIFLQPQKPTITCRSKRLEK